MGNKANSNVMRKRMTETASHWFAFGVNDFCTLLHREFKIREYLKKYLDQKIISKISVAFEGPKKEGVKISILTSRPGMIIGKQGIDIENRKKALKGLDPKNINVSIDVIDVINQDLDAQMVASRIAAGITQRKTAKRVMKEAVMRTMLAGAKGIKIICSGRHGRDIAADEKSYAGSVSLQTFSENIIHHQMQAPTTMGTMGVKVWISKFEKPSTLLMNKKSRSRNDEKYRKFGDRYTKNNKNEKNDKTKQSFSSIGE